MNLFSSSINALHVTPVNLNKVNIIQLKLSPSLCPSQQKNCNIFLKRDNLADNSSGKEETNCENRFKVSLVSRKRFFGFVTCL